MTPTHLPEIPAYFYRTTGGTEPVLDWLRSLPAEDRRAIGTDLATVQFGWPIGMRFAGLWAADCGSAQHSAKPAHRPPAVLRR